MMIDEALDEVERSTQARRVRAKVASLPFDRPIPINELARYLEIPTHRCRRQLMRLRKKYPERTVVECVNGRWQVPSLYQLQSFWPDIGKPFFAAETVQKLESVIRDQGRSINSLRARIRDLEQSLTKLAPLVVRLGMKLAAIDAGCEPVTAAEALALAGRTRAG